MFVSAHIRHINMHEKSTQKTVLCKGKLYLTITLIFVTERLYVNRTTSAPNSVLCYVLDWILRSRLGIPMGSFFQILTKLEHRVGEGPLSTRKNNAN